MRFHSTKEDVINTTIIVLFFIVSLPFIMIKTFLSKIKLGVRYEEKTHSEEKRT